jgi:CRISPR-associated protein (TIGR03985 family)
LRSLYGDEGSRIELPQVWTYTDWRDAFFFHTHPKTDQIPLLHDKNCACAKTIADWIFAGDIEIEENEWKDLLVAYCFTQSSSISNLSKKEDLLIVDSDGRGRGKTKKTLDDTLHRRLFAVTRRTLQEDLYILQNLGLIQSNKTNKTNYQLIESFPKLDFLSKSKQQTGFNLQDLTFSNVNLETTLETFSEPIGGYRRFYLEVDYIIPDNRDDVEDCQNYLKEVWNSQPIPPVQFTYKSRKLGNSINLIVYPVCIYYARRAIYLSAFGQTPNNQGEWYNYRLDRIQHLKTLNWSDSRIPEVLLKHYPNKLLTPEYIKEQLSEAWGYDFYEQSRLLILRFERKFHDSYIEGTFRHEKFKKISFQQVIKEIEQYDLEGKVALVKLMKKRSPDDAYYKVYYRDKDVNIMHRLRSWRPNGEVLFPWDLRQKLAQEAIQEVQNYQD